MKLKERIEFKLDTKTKRLLEEMARDQGRSLGELIRELLRKQLGTLTPSRVQKQRAARYLVDLKIKQLPPPEKLDEEISLAFGEDGA
ncbi:CopG family transcriptional regulator [Candidatus Acetothermia bacterium]|nr:CopG family transcriptional regulator [Candidatus Acetothermia bacterium]MBI3461044.1 CopG family transcriptional regulator [Candidatus Acetothermia bacterium]